MVAHRSEAQTCKTNIEERGLWGTRLITKKVAKKYFFSQGEKKFRRSTIFGMVGMPGK